MNFKELDTVVLDRDLPEHGLRRGDLGAVVQVYDPDGLEVEFVTASGRTQALVTLEVGDVRAVGDQDLVSVRTLKRGAASLAAAAVRGRGWCWTFMIELLRAFGAAAAEPSDRWTPPDTGMGT